MANNIEINQEVVSATISEVNNTIINNQLDIDRVYDSLIEHFAESSGETADALRSLQKAEQSLADEVWITLADLSSSINFATEEFAKLDMDMKNIMSNTVSTVTNNITLLDKSIRGER